MAAVFLHNDLLTEVLSVLPVKSLVRFKCVSKHWKTLISDQSFVKLHLRRSQTRNQFLTLVTSEGSDRSVVPYPISRLLDNPSFTLFDDLHLHPRLKYKEEFHIVGSCNGLILLAGEYTNFNGNIKSWTATYCLSVWNPATRATSENFGYFLECGESSCQRFYFAFVCDNSNDTYSVVAFRYAHSQPTATTETRVLSSGDYVWRNIESSVDVFLPYKYLYLSETIYWLANDNHKDIIVEQFIIVSYDLRTETYKKIDVPCGCNQVSSNQHKPVLGVLGDRLCFSYYYEEMDFVIWQMNELGVKDSWTQFIKIKDQTLRIGYDYSNYRYPWVPLLLSESDDTLILTSRHEPQAILYNWRDNKVTQTNIIASRTSSSLDWKDAKVYVESLVPIF